MPHYLLRFTYSSENWSRLVANPEDRTEPVRRLVESVGGTFHGLWYTFGDRDGYVLVEAPDNATAASVSVAAAAAGVGSIETTILIPASEMLEALQKAKGAEYRPPGG